MPQGTMKALYYSAPKQFEIKQVPIPQVGDDDVLLKVTCCGVCGTDGHIHEGEFISKFPLIPGHEAIGTIVEMGKNVKGFDMGDRCVADVGTTCGNCFYCRRGTTLMCESFGDTSGTKAFTHQSFHTTCGNCFYCRRGTTLMCESFGAAGVTRDGGFAEYILYHQSKLYKIKNLTDEESTLLEPAACAIHGLDKLNPPVGIEVLLMGAGPTGLILAQLLKLNGASRVVVAANKGIKMDIAKDLDAADEYIELDRQNPDAQWQKLKEDNPYGFDVVVEATGVEKLANDSINYVRRGGTLMIYGVYENKALVHWPPSKIFGDEIRIIGSFSQTYCFPRAVAYLDSGKVRVKGMVTDVYKLEEFQAALDKMNSRKAVKIAIKP